MVQGGIVLTSQIGFTDIVYHLTFGSFASSLLPSSEACNSESLSLEIDSANDSASFSIAFCFFEVDFDFFVLFISVGGRPVEHISRTFQSNDGITLTSLVLSRPLPIPKGLPRLNPQLRTLRQQIWFLSVMPLNSQPWDQKDSPWSLFQWRAADFFSQ